MCILVLINVRAGFLFVGAESHAVLIEDRVSIFWCC